MLCYGYEKNGMVRSGHGCGMASMNQTRPNCVNEMGKTHSKPSVERHGRSIICALSVLWAGQCSVQFPADQLNSIASTLFNGQKGFLP